MSDNGAPPIRIAAISDEMRSSYLDYAMSVIVSRALPDVRDGLKPVQRRILYAMHDQGMRPNSSYKKSARLVGEVLGKYHPHGDSPVYDAMVRMAQDFSMHHPLVDGQGNYGSIDGDPPAAMRYTECRMASIATTILEDIDKETVDWRENFDQSTLEPVVLPARLPNLLLNGATGIAVGLATNIPPHNLTELCDAIIHLAQNPDTAIEDLMQFVTGPDFPTGGYIRGSAGIRDGYLTGRGRIILEAKYTEEKVPGSERNRIIVTEIPYQVNKANLIMDIAAMINKRTLEGASSVRDESDRKGLRIVIDLRRGASTGVVINNLFRYTKLRTSYNFNTIALVGGVPQLINLKQALQSYVDFRKEIIKRRSEYDLKQARARLHILEGLRVAIANLDDVIATIRSSDNVEMARERLIERFGMTEIQAQAVLDMQLRRLAALEREKIDNEYTQLTQLVAELESLLTSPEKVTGVVVEETEGLRQKYGRARRTLITDAELGVWRREDIELHKEVVITLSKNGYIKRLDSSTYKAQHRGGKGVRGQRMSKENDITNWMQVADTHDTLLMFTSRGRVFGMRVFELSADQSRNSRGTPVQTLIETLQPRETVQCILAVSDILEDVNLMMATKKGRIKRIHLSLLRSLRKSGLICFHIQPEDSLVSVGLAATEQSIVMVSRDGMAIRFTAESIKLRQRRSGARRGMVLNKGDYIVAMTVASDDAALLVVTERGYGKISLLDTGYRIQNPGGKGLRTLKVTKKNGQVASATAITPELRQDSEGRLFLLTRNAQVLRTNLSEIKRNTSRITQGVILVKPDEKDEISSIQIIARREKLGRIITEEEADKIERSASDDTDQNAPDDTNQNSSEVPDDSGEAGV